MIVKYCPACGQENLPSESFCTQCDFDLLTVSSEPRRDDSGHETASESGEAPVIATDFCRLELLDDPKISFQIAPGQSVGRGVEADVLIANVPHGTYISRRHAQFSRRGPQWFVQYVASGNFIKVDGETYDDDAVVALHDGTILTLSLCSFRVVLP